MNKFTKEYLEKILIKKLKQDNLFKEILNLVKSNSFGNIYLIGGKISRTLVKELYGYCEDKSDYDFIVDDLKKPIYCLGNWKVSYHKFGNPTFKKNNIEVDIFPIKELSYIKKNNLDPTIDNFLKGVPFTIQSLALDVDSFKLIGNKGIEAINTKKFKINNLDSAKELVLRKNVSINERMKQKAKSMGFDTVPYNS